MTTTMPNMGLIIPDPSVTPGPLYAQQEVTAFQTIDAHDHTAGRGVLITPGAMNINADLNIASNNLDAVRTLRLSTQTITPAGASDTRIVYVKNNELAYRDGAGAEVILTSNGSVAGATGTITGLTSPASASFTSVSGIFAFQKDTSKPGKLAISDINVYEYNNAAASAITIKSPASLASAYNLTLPPLVPTQAAVLSMSTSGALTAGLADGTVSAPGMAFASELGTGVYRPTTSQLALTISGTQRMLVTATATTLGTTLSSGALTVTGGAGITGTLAVTGAVTSSLGLTVASGGAAITGSSIVTGAMTVTSGLSVTGGAGVAGVLTSTGVINGADGSAGAPSYSFFNETNTGFYRASAGVVGVTVAGTEVYSFGAGSLTLVGGTKLSIGDATAGSPSIYFGNETNTGIYRSAAGQLAVSVSGTNAAIFNGSGLTLAGGIAFNAGGGFYKTAYFSGTLLSGNVVDLVISGSVLGATGRQTTAGNVGIIGSGSNVAFAVNQNTPATTVRLVNNGGGTHTYTAVVFYQ